MTNKDIILAENSLIRVTRFISPEYNRKYIGIQEPSDCDRPAHYIYEDAPKEDRVLEWLAGNTILKLREPFPEHFHSDWGYFLQGSEGISCIINPKHHQLISQNVYGPANPLLYQWRVTIRSQPKDLPLPKELRSALEEMSFKEVSEFD